MIVLENDPSWSQSRVNGAVPLDYEILQNVLGVKRFSCFQNVHAPLHRRDNTHVLAEKEEPV